jgi:hypothetical protein
VVSKEEEEAGSKLQLRVDVKDGQDMCVYSVVVSWQKSLELRGRS